MHFTNVDSIQCSTHIHLLTVSGNNKTTHLGKRCTEYMQKLYILFRAFCGPTLTKTNRKKKKKRNRQTVSSKTGKPKKRIQHKHMHMHMHTHTERASFGTHMDKQHMGVPTSEAHLLVCLSSMYVVYVCACV